MIKFKSPNLNRISAMQKLGILIFGILLFFNSCKTSNCILCELDNSTLYNVELKNSVGTLGKSNFQSFFPPVLLERTKNKKELYVIDCDRKDAYLLEGNDLETFIKENVKVIKPEQIKNITTTSDVDVPPTKYYPKPPDKEIACIRYRKAIKFETRAMLGVQPWWLSEGSITYPGLNGSTTYDRKLSGVQSLSKPNSSIIKMGLETAMLLRIFRFNGHHSLSVGPMVGIWPVDGGLYVPLSFHPRLTFNDITSPIWGNCDAFYLFGDLGTAYDALGIIPFLHNDEFSSSFWGIGIGVDLWKNRRRDLSFDVGYRRTNMSLPTNKDYLDCLELSGRTNSLPNPKRITDQFFIRIGYTW